MMARKKKQPKRKEKKEKKRKLSLKRVAKALAKTIWKHLVELPEKERERTIAALARVVSKKLKRLRGAKPGNRRTAHK